MTELVDRRQRQIEHSNLGQINMVELIGMMNRDAGGVGRLNLRQRNRDRLFDSRRWRRRIVLASRESGERQGEANTAEHEGVTYDNAGGSVLATP